ncbi:FAD dependent oxidoreductase [Cercophora newfieldiana]|uniref:FAD dependent oxidoreductase n=1 Tax=Cercophora newfieldiana TaxID=92897 RepID=A0AA39YRC4_9PEZI|nr:FAD dependent oxidoreductase [Cercophora newfieldiana]
MSSTVVIGAGIIGLSTAYYLSDHQPPSTIHLVESSPELFSSASGYAGGFLAKDWFKSQLLSLGALSFELHKKLAAAHSGREKWHYSPTTSFNYAPSRQDGGQKRGDDWLRHGTSRAQAAPTEPEVTDGDDAKDLAAAPSWLRRIPGDHIELTSTEETTAQLDPLLLCRFLLEECRKRGVKLHHPATVTSVSADLRGELSSVRIVDAGSGAETDLPCTRVIIAAGAWSGRVFRELFRLSDLEIPVGSLAGHSVVVRSPRWKGEEGERCHAVYTTHGKGFSPEMYARVGGEIYLAGLNLGVMPLPRVTGKAPVVGEDMERVRETADMLLGDDLEIVREGLCFRPVTPWGVPIIERITDEHLGPGMGTRAGADGGVYVVTGHGPWGIALSLGTGLVVAEWAQGRPLSADVSGLGLKMT